MYRYGSSSESNVPKIFISYRANGFVEISKEYWKHGSTSKEDYVEQLSHGHDQAHTCAHTHTHNPNIAQLCRSIESNCIS